jgi:sarcosine oxidase subunit alpha
MRITLDGQAVEAAPGDTIAAALLRARITTFTRSIKYHRPRGPFCLEGSCGQCLMRVDGVPSLPACRVRAEEGMVCERQNAPLGLIDADLFRAADFLFPQGLDHHHLLTQSRLLGRVALEIARRLAGLGELPAEDRPPAAGALRAVPLAVVGAGRAGVAAARAAAEAGCGTLLIEREAQAGGAASLQLDAGEDLAWVGEQVRRFTAAGGELLTGAECVGLYPDGTAQPGNALLAVRRGGALLAVLAERVVVATGCASQPLPFPGVDRPGVYAARGLLRLGVRVGRTLAVVGEGSEAAACAEGLRRCGYQIARTAAPGSRLRALGNPVAALEVDGERVRCDAIAIALPPAPLHELASSAGAKAKWDGAGFPLEIDAAGRTGVGWLFAAGSVAGKAAGKATSASGEAAGKAACR